MTQEITIVGAGWAGLAAAVKATQLGLKVNLFEATHTPGGRAKSVVHQGALFDNGQHALIGAYSDTLALLQTIGLEAQALFKRQGLKWSYPNGACFGLPQDAYPFKALRSLLLCQRFSAVEKSSLLKPLLFALSHMLWAKEDDTVANLFKGVSPQIMRDIVSPLCLSALNTPISRASANTFVRVLRDAFSNPPESCEFLFPIVPLGEVFPLPCLNWLRERGARIELGHRIDSLNALDPKVPCILALPPWQASKLTQDKHAQWSKLAGNLQHEAIASIYLKGERSPANSNTAHANQNAVVCLNEHFEAENCVHPQFAIQRFAPLETVHFERLSNDSLSEDSLTDNSLTEHWALIVSAADPSERQKIIEHALLAARKHLKLQNVQLQLCTMEKRATFSCDAKLQRPPSFISEGLMACGDYVQGPYPGTLEGAVRSGLRAVTELTRN